MDWKLALAQHPMYLIIREDSKCAERTPPWGEPDIESYIERLRQNLGALGRYQDLKFGYEWSGLELEMLAEDAPEVIQKMRSLFREDRIAFYNGTYSQPHLQILSAEANVRQFEYGLRVYQELFGRSVHVYAHQEASVHDQVPQLLRAFGYRFASLPGFFSTLAWLDEGELRLHGFSGPRFIQGDEFVLWRSLDGTEIPLYLHQPVPWDLKLKTWLEREELAGRLCVPPIIIDNPDLIPIDEKWLVEHKRVDLVLLNEALERRFAQAPPRTRARLFTNWSYIEGVQAEELSRTNLQAELNVLQAEAIFSMAFSLIQRQAENIDALWKRILATQHHDVYWVGAPELREKAIQELKDVQIKANRLADTTANAIIAKVHSLDGPGQPLVVLNTLPHAQLGIATVDVNVKDPLVVDQRVSPIPIEAYPVKNNLTRMRFLTEMPGFGYQTYWLGNGGEIAQELDLDGSLHFENSFYEVIVLPDGTFASLQVKPTGEELLDTSAFRGNQLAAVDSAGIHQGSEQKLNAPAISKWKNELRDRQLIWESIAPSIIRQSSLGLSMLVKGQLGERVKADLSINFYYQLPRIDMTWTFNFDSASLGIFFNDDTKLKVHWPLSFTAVAYHDIPFGVVQTREERPFFPTSWVDISCEDKGFAYFHQGTFKHWITDHALVNLFAWGDNTDVIGNRQGWSRWLKSFDQRLSGTHEVHCSIYPHIGDWQTSDVMSAVRAYRFPPRVYLTDPREGKLPSSMEILRLDSKVASATSIRTSNSQVKIRLFALGDNNTSIISKMQGMELVGINSLASDQITSLKSFQIGELILEPVS